MVPDVFNYIEVRTLRLPGKCKDSIAFEKIACLSSFVAWSIVLLEEEGLVLIAIDFSDTVGEIFFKNLYIVIRIYRPFAECKVPNSIRPDASPDHY